MPEIWGIWASGGFGVSRIWGFGDWGVSGIQGFGNCKDSGIQGIQGFRVVQGFRDAGESKDSGDSGIGGFGFHLSPSLPSPPSFRCGEEGGEGGADEREGGEEGFHLSFFCHVRLRRCF